MFWQSVVQYDVIAGLSSTCSVTSSRMLITTVWCMLLCLQDLKVTGVPVLSWDDFLFVGETRPREAVPPTPEDISTIMYTSGTTGATLCEVMCVM